MNEALHYVLYNVALALTPFLQRDSYLYWPYIASSLLIAAATWYWLSAGRLWRGFWRSYFGGHVWWHRSAQADYWLYFANALLVPGLFTVLLVNDRQLAAWIASSLGLAEGQSGQEVTSTGVRIAFTAAFFIAYDFGRFVAHCLLHDVPVLWEFHKVHHSAEVLTPMTTFRAHPLELLLMAWAPLIATGIVTVIFNAIVPGAITVYTFLGWNIFLFWFNLVDNLRHSPVWLSYGHTLGRWLISPAHHQLHHSCEPQHLGCNRGFELAIWDRLYGTLYLPAMQPESFRLGLGDASDARYHHLGRMYWLPFVNAGDRIIGLARRSLRRAVAR